jgi:hypothetical protein
MRAAASTRNRIAFLNDHHEGKTAVESLLAPARYTRLSVCLVAMVLASCGTQQVQGNSLAEGAVHKQITECGSPRPDVCSFQYRPVCASKDTGVRCITTPCPSTEWQTYGNACTACSEPKVYGYRDGSCETSKNLSGIFPSNTS